jgi:hypothetical protein
VAIQNLAIAYGRLINADGVVAPVAAKMHLRMGQVRGRLSAAPIPLAPLITVTAIGPTARDAITLANDASTSLSNYVANLNLGVGTAQRLQSQYQPAAAQLNKLHTQLTALLAKPSTPAIQRQRLALQDAVQQQALQVDALKNAYLQSQTSRGSASIVQTLNSAQTASSNKNSHLEAYLIGGLVIGLLIGMSLAKWRQDGIMGIGGRAREFDEDLEDLWEREPATVDRRFDTMAPRAGPTPRAPAPLSAPTVASCTVPSVPGGRSRRFSAPSAQESDPPR